MRSPKEGWTRKRATSLLGMLVGWDFTKEKPLKVPNSAPTYTHREFELSGRIDQQWPSFNCPAQGRPGDGSGDLKI